MALITPRRGHRPLIAISPNAFPAEDRRFYKNKALEYGEQSMAEAVRIAGGLPMLAYRAGASAGDLAHLAEAVMARAQALVLSGGADISPAMYGEQLADPRWAGDPDRDRWELALYRAAIHMRRPVLGVCRGVQLINVAEGGTLWQDLRTMRPGSLQHRCQERYDDLAHDLSIEPGSVVAELFGDEDHHVNSVHHQGLKDLAPRLVPLAWAPDGAIEAVRLDDELPVLGVQWHPEWMLARASQRAAFRWLVGVADRVGEVA